MQHTILASFLVEAETHEEAVGLAQSAVDYAYKVSNDDGAIVACGVETPDCRTVWVAHYDNRGGVGVDLYRSKESAVASVMSCITDDELEDAELTRDEAAALLEEDGYLHLKRREEYYRVTCETVRD